MVQLLRKTVFLKKLRTELPYDTATPPPGVHPKELRAGSGRDMHTPTFTAASCTAVKEWKQSRCPPTNVMDSQTVVYTQWNIVSALERKEILHHATTSMKLEDILLREISQSQKEKYCMSPYI